MMRRKENNTAKEIKFGDHKLSVVKATNKKVLFKIIGH